MHNRKNALFTGSPEGARSWAVIGSFMETCRMSDVDPLAWLTGTLEKLAAGHSIKDLDALMPWNFSISANGKGACQVALEGVDGVARSM